MMTPLDKYLLCSIHMDLQVTWSENLYETLVPSKWSTTCAAWWKKLRGSSHVTWSIQHFETQTDAPAFWQNTKRFQAITEALDPQEGKTVQALQMLIW